MAKLGVAYARRLTQLALCLALLCMVSFVSRSSASFIRARRVSAQDVTEELVKLINDQRRQHDRAPVCTNMKIMRASQYMANDMADSDYFSGTGEDTSSPAERVSGQNFVFTTLTEDVAAGFETAQAALAALMDVQEHRDNILGDYKFVGAGYSYGRSTGYKHFWSIHFANAINELCDAPSEKKHVEEKSLLQRWMHL